MPDFIEITSKNNPLIKETATLKDKKGRKQLGAFLVEGVYTLATNQTVVAYTENAVFEICITAIVKA